MALAVLLTADCSVLQKEGPYASAGCLGKGNLMALASQLDLCLDLRLVDDWVPAMVPKMVLAVLLTADYLVLQKEGRCC